MFEEILKRYLLVSNPVSSLLAVLFMLEVCKYSSKMFNHQKVIAVLSIPLMIFFSIEWGENRLLIQLIISGLVLGGCFADIFHLKDAGREWKLINILEFILLAFLVFGSITNLVLKT